MDSTVKKVRPYEIPFSVWDLIKTIVSDEELPQIRSSIGESLIDSCIDLRTEVETLLEIWRHMNDSESDREPSRHMNDSLRKAPINPLPDPPQMTEMLKSEIKMLIKNLNTTQRRSSSSLLNEVDIQTINYVVKNPTVERPNTPARPVDEMTTSSSTPVRLKDVRRNINVCDVDRVMKVLREAISKECKELENDVGFLQGCIENEHEETPSGIFSPRGDNALKHEPSLNQLKQTRKKLENELLHNCKTSAPPRMLSAPLLRRRTSSSSSHSKRKEKISGRSRDDDPDNHHILHARECWVEPSWTDEMSDHKKSHRPSSSRNLRTITSRLDSLNVNKKPTPSKVKPSTSLPTHPDKLKEPKKKKLVITSKTMLPNSQRFVLPTKPVLRPPLLTRRLPKTIGKSTLAK